MAQSAFDQILNFLIPAGVCIFMFWIFFKAFIGMGGDKLINKIKEWMANRKAMKEGFSDEKEDNTVLVFD